LPLTQTLPDLETKLVVYLKTYVALTAITSTRISTQLPPNPVFPSLRLQRIGGTPDRFGYDHPIIQFDCYGTTDMTAFAVVEKTFKAVMELPYVAPVQGTVVIGSADPTTPINYLPDTARQDTQGKPQPRYIFAVVFRVQQQ
jgi:hypothetical protein